MNLYLKKERKVQLWESLYDPSQAAPELKLNHHLALILEQVRVERLACFKEIAELRALLDDKHIAHDNVEPWIHRSDKVLDTLLRYKLGKSGKLVKEGMLTMPYRWRRKFRNGIA
ncbi:hypothetical protein [Dryocola sp. LX212]|jgi:hypothetical protein